VTLLLEHPYSTLKRLRRTRLSNWSTTNQSRNLQEDSSAVLNRINTSNRVVEIGGGVNSMAVDEGMVKVSVATRPVVVVEVEEEGAVAVNNNSSVRISGGTNSALSTLPLSIFDPNGLSWETRSRCLHCINFLQILGSLRISLPWVLLPHMIALPTG